MKQEDFDNLVTDIHRAGRICRGQAKPGGRGLPKGFGDVVLYIASPFPRLFLAQDSRHSRRQPGKRRLLATRVRLCRRHLLRATLFEARQSQDASEQLSKVEGLGTVGASPGDKK
jgi:hypothetical protein